MHAPTNDHKSLTKIHAAPGEPFVWLTAMGLAIGLIMVFGLLWIIVSNGLPVFWPSKVVSVELKQGLVSPLAGGGSVVLGELTQEREKRIQSAGQGPKEMELQFFVANKDAYGLSFVYLDANTVASREFPSDIMAIERIEYGDAFGYPVALKLADGTTVAAGQPEFAQALAREVKVAAERRQQISRIEKQAIGRINAQMNDLRVREVADKDDRLAQLNAEYDILAAEARALRAQQSSAQLVIKIANGSERSIDIGNILDYYYPNRLSFFTRFGMFFHNIWNFLSQAPREANTEGGVFPAIFGTFVMTLLMSIAVVPFGVVAAIYLREYANQGFFVRCVRIAVNNLAGVPSIVFGVFGLGFFVYFVGGSFDRLFFSDYLPTPTFGTGGILWASLTLALMTVPVVIVATEESIASVPRGMKEGSLACGASKWQTIQRIILPASLPGILTGLILAMARGAGEVAPLMLVGVVKLAPSLPLDGEYPFFHLERKFMHLGFHIYDLGFQSPDSEAAKPMVFATTLLLITLVVVLNLAAILIRERLRRKFTTGAF